MSAAVVGGKAAPSAEDVKKPVAWSEIRENRAVYIMHALKTTGVNYYIVVVHVTRAGGSG